MARNGVSILLEVDASDLMGKIDTLKAVMQPEQFNRAMYGIFRDTSRHVSKILKQDLPREYEVKPGAIGKAVKSPKLTMGSMGAGCAIPIRDARGSIGSTYRASGGAHGWISLHKKYRVKAKIVKAGQSTLPAKTSDGYPPFRNLGSKLGGLTFARRSKARLPIRKVVGIAIPQMPMNRSEGSVQRDIRVYLERRIDQRFTALMMNGK